MLLALADSALDADTRQRQSHELEVELEFADKQSATPASVVWQPERRCFKEPTTQTECVLDLRKTLIVFKLNNVVETKKLE